MNAMRACQFSKRCVIGLMSSERIGPVLPAMSLVPAKITTTLGCRSIIILAELAPASVA
jgi:hypothetical protein